MTTFSKALVRLHQVKAHVALANAERNAYLDGAEPFPKDPDLRKFRGQSWDNEGILQDKMDALLKANPKKALQLFEKDPEVKKLSAVQETLRQKIDSRIDELVDKVKDAQADKKNAKHFLRRESRS
jgi:hypothetical protein